MREQVSELVRVWAKQWSFTWLATFFSFAVESESVPGFLSLLFVLSLFPLLSLLVIRLVFWFRCSLPSLCFLIVESLCRKSGSSIRFKWRERAQEVENSFWWRICTTGFFSAFFLCLFVSFHFIFLSAVCCSRCLPYRGEISIKLCRSSR